MTDYNRPQSSSRGMDGYNGWPNYETWCVNLWLTNDHDSYTTVRAIAREANDRYTAAECIREWVEEANPLTEQASLYADLVSSALREVHWMSIIEDFLAD